MLMLSSSSFMAASGVPDDARTGARQLRSVRATFLWCLRLACFLAVCVVAVLWVATVVSVAAAVLPMRVPAAGATAAVFARGACSAHAVDDGEPPRLPPRMALAVAVQPAPGVDVGGGTAVCDCASAAPAVNATAISARGVLVFIGKLLDVPGDLHRSCKRPSQSCVTWPKLVQDAAYAALRISNDRASYGARLHARHMVTQQSADMKRRCLFVGFACWTVLPLLAQDTAARPHHHISAAELHKALSARFPVRLGAPSLLDVQVDAPRLLLLPATQQLGATLQVQVDGLQLPQAPAGEADVAFALRYEPADRSIRAHRLRVLDVRWPGLPPETVQAAQALLRSMARQAVGEIVLHRFEPRELVLADTMGFEPETIAVEDDGLLITFGPKRPR